MKMAPINSVIVVLLNIGHKASHLEVPDGDFTHTWTAYVQGADKTDISHFVERVVFKLHETFEKPVQLITKPPYTISEKGYASFGLKLEVVFKNSDKPNLIEYEYDLVLPGEGQPPVKYFRQEKLIFRNTPEDFRQKLLRGGAKETDPQAKEELAKQRAAAAAAAAADKARQTETASLKSDDEKQKKKKDKSSKHKKKDKADKSKSPGTMFGLARDDRTSKSTPSRSMLSSDSSSSSSSSDSPSNSPNDQHKAAKSSRSQYGYLSSSGDESTSKAASKKRPQATPTHNGVPTGAKRNKASAEKSMKKSERTPSGSVKKASNGMPLDMLLDLHEKIKETNDPDLLQSFVDIIEETGTFKLTETSFDFDLCVLDSSVINRLQNLFK